MFIPHNPTAAIITVGERRRELAGPEPEPNISPTPVLLKQFGPQQFFRFATRFMVCTSMDPFVKTKNYKNKTMFSFVLKIGSGPISTIDMDPVFQNFMI